MDCWGIPALTKPLAVALSMALLSSALMERVSTNDQTIVVITSVYVGGMWKLY